VFEPHVGAMLTALDDLQGITMRTSCFTKSIQLEVFSQLEVCKTYTFITEGVRKERKDGKFDIFGSARVFDGAKLVVGGIAIATTQNVGF
jgi:hypothetical protein